MNHKEIRKILEDKDTFDKLKQIGFIRDKIRHLNREINKYEASVSKTETEIILKHKIEFPDLIAITIMADRIYEEKGELND